MKNDYYTYAYLREDGTPYYIGKGRGDRAFSKTHNVGVPPRERILFLKKNLTEGEAHKHEVYMIAIYGRKDKGTGILWNFTDGGEGCSGRQVSGETRKKLSRANKGRKHRRGHKLSEETRRKISEAKKGKPKSEEHRKKLSEANKGKMPSEANRRAVREANLGNTHGLGRKHSEETRRKRSESLKHAISKGALVKPVEVTLPSGKIGCFPSVKLACFFLGINKMTLSALTRGDGERYRKRGYSARFI